MKKRVLLSVLVALLFFSTAKGQYTQMTYKGERDAYIDSLENNKYPYVLPVLGQKSTELGFQLPFPMGITTSGVYSKQGITLSNLAIGVNGDTNVDLAPACQYIDATGEAWVSNLRLDAYLFPFLSVYGLFGTANTTTHITLDVPPGSTLSQTHYWINETLGKTGFGPYHITSPNNGIYYGGGFTAAGGFGNYWGAIDANWAFADMDLLDSPVLTRILSMRWGRSFPLKNKPHQNIAVWTVMSNFHVNNEDQGKVPFSTLGVTGTGLKDFVANNPNLPQNIKDQILDIANNIETGTLDYSFQKDFVSKWAFGIGVQWELNKHLQLRGEAGWGVEKQQYVLSATYRFGIKGHNIWSDRIREKEAKKNKKISASSSESTE